MATIALYAGKMNHMPNLVKDVRSSVKDLKSELATIMSKSQSIDRNICELDDIIYSISASTRIQEEKMNALDSLREGVEQFALEVEKIDSNVADKINEGKEDFYDKYYYLKPGCEKSLLENMWNSCKSGLKSAAEWCKEHWKLVVTALLVVAAIIAIVVLPGVGGAIAAIGLMAAKGLLAGAVVGGLFGGTMNCLTGGSFWEGFEDGVFEGAISGAISGALSGGIKILALAGKIKPLTRMGNVIFGSIIPDAGASVLGNIGDIIINGKNISVFKIVSDAVVSAIFAGVTSVTPKLKFSGKTKGNGSWKHVWNTQSTRFIKYGTNIHLKTIFKGIGAEIVDKMSDFIFEWPKKKIEDWKDSWNFLPQY